MAHGPGLPCQLGLSSPRDRPEIHTFCLSGQHEGVFAHVMFCILVVPVYFL